MSFFSVPSFVCPLLGEKPLDSRLKMSGMTEEGMLGMTEGVSGMKEGDVGHDGREGVPDFVGIAGFAVIPVLSCHACWGSFWRASCQAVLEALADLGGRALLSFTRRDTRR